MFSQVNDDFEDSPRTPTTQRSINQRPGDSSGPGNNYIWSIPKSNIVSSGPLTSPDLPPTLWRTGRETKPRRIGINLQKNTIQVGALKKNQKELTHFTQPETNDTFQTVTEGAPVQVRKYQIERRIFQVNPIKNVLTILFRNFWN